MPALIVSTLPVTLDSGSSDYLQIRNDGFVEVVIRRGSDNPIVLWPNCVTTVAPVGQAVTGSTPSGSTQVTTSAGVADVGLPGEKLVRLQDLADDALVYYPNASARATVVARPVFLDGRDYGMLGNYTTDETAFLQAALDASVVTPYSTFAGNDLPSVTVQLPPGRCRVSTAGLPGNVTLQGHGPSATYLYAIGTSGDVLHLKTGTEVQVCLRDFGIINNADAVDGIVLAQTNQASILSDARHVLQNLAIVGGRQAVFSGGNSECRFIDIVAYRQKPTVNSAALNFGGSDWMAERCTVAQVQYVGSGQGGAGMRLGTSNSRVIDCKVFGGNASAGGQQQDAIYVIGQRNQFIGCEVQDYAGGWGVYDQQGGNTWMGGIIDSVRVGGFILGGGSTIRGMRVLNRAGGAYTMGTAFNCADGLGADVDAAVTGVGALLNGGQTGAGNRFRVNGEGGVASVAYAATITPNPNDATTYVVGTLTGALTLADPTSAMTRGIRPGMRLELLLTQDATGGRVVTFGSSFKTTSAVATTASSSTLLAFVYDGTYWREQSRALT